jgi:hypothetical protein
MSGLLQMTRSAHDEFAFARGASAAILQRCGDPVTAKAAREHDCGANSACLNLAQVHAETCSPSERPPDLLRSFALGRGPIMGRRKRTSGTTGKILQAVCVAAAIVVVPVIFVVPLSLRDLPKPAIVQADVPPPAEQPAVVSREAQAMLDVDRPATPIALPKDLSYLADYAYAEVLPDRKPADSVLQSLQDIPLGTPIDEIKLASNAFGLDFVFMKAVARIESDFDPKQKTGSYIGLFQLSNYEFNIFGSGDITSARDNSVAAAYKFATAAILFEIDTHIKPTLFDLYLIHQQGWQGAAEHISHPERIAWQSMCATDEGHDKGEKWCKRAIWQNTLPDIKKIYKSVENLTSGVFTEMWRQRIAMFYSRYSEEVSAK